MTGLYVAFAALSVAYLATRRRPRPATVTTELTVLAVEGRDVLIAYSHPQHSGLTWMTKQDVLQKFLELHGSGGQNMAIEDINGRRISLPVSYATWAQIVEAV